MIVFKSVSHFLCLRLQQTLRSLQVLQEIFLFYISVYLLTYNWVEIILNVSFYIKKRFNSHNINYLFWNILTDKFVFLSYFHKVRQLHIKSQKSEKNRKNHATYILPTFEISFVQIENYQHKTSP